MIQMKMRTKLAMLFHLLIHDECAAAGSGGGRTLQNDLCPHGALRRGRGAYSPNLIKSPPLRTTSTEFLF